MAKNKERKDLYIDTEVFKHAKKNPMIKSLSDWINKKYAEDFMQKEKLEEFIHITMCTTDKAKKQLETINSQISQQKLPQEIKVELPVLKKKIREGYDKIAILRRLNNDYGVDWSHEQFSKILDDVEEVKEDIK